MAVRANEAAFTGYERAVRYLIRRELDGTARERGRDCIVDLIERVGPVVDSYPAWHPLVANHDPMMPVTTPSDRCGYLGLDHTVYFRNGFITCPYGGGEAVLESVGELRSDGVTSIHAERLDVTLYRPDVSPILVYCDWSKPMLVDGTIPQAMAVPMILEREVPCWRQAQLAEPWETMRPYLLGEPCGKRSSLFINQETGATIRKIWIALMETGAFGPIKVSQR